MASNPQSDQFLPINPAIVTWARNRAGYSIDEASKYFKNIDLWEQGKEMPTYPQLEAMAEKLKCPIAVFFFPEPPELPSAQQTFRTLPADDFEQIPRTVRAFLRKGQAMQLNLSELNDGKNPARRLIVRDLRVSPDEGVSSIAKRLREYLGITLDAQRAWSDVEAALEEWRNALADAGVFVFKDAFHASGYFGFCLYDDEFPIIYINNTSTKTRQIFTLFHELAHLLFHTSGIDIEDDYYIEHLRGDDRKIEVICNALAAQFLVPVDDLAQQLKTRKPDRAAAAVLADRYKVSREVVYRQFLERRLISAEEYENAAREWTAQIKKEKGGGNYYFNQFAYLGDRYIDLAFSRFRQGRFGEDRLANFLNIKPKNVAAFELTYEALR